MYLVELNHWCFMVNASELHFEAEENLGLKEIQLPTV